MLRTENKHYLCGVLYELKKTKGELYMARPIKETPILFGEDARRFMERMKQPRTETKEQRERRLRAYEKIMRNSKL